MDYFLFQKVNSLADKFFWLDAAGIFLADYFQYLLIAAIIFLFQKKWRAYIQIILSVVLARLVLTELIRFFYYRSRPFVDYQVNQLIFHEPDGSFPSGHAAFFFALASAVYFRNKKAGYWFFAAAFLISAARIFAGVHYPSDILVGAIVGIFSGWLINKFKIFN